MSADAVDLALVEDYYDIRVFDRGYPLCYYYLRPLGDVIFE